MINRIFSKLFLFIMCALFINSMYGQQVQSQNQIIQNITVPNEVIVRMHDGLNPELVLSEVPSNFELKIDRVLSKRSDIWLFTFNDQVTNVSEVLNYVKKNDGVWLAQRNTEVDLRVAPNDPLYGNQWQHTNIDSEAAWDITTGGTTATGDDIVVCAVSYTHLTLPTIYSV